MANNVDEMSFQISGESAVKTAMSILEGLDDDSQFKSAQIILRTKDSKQPTENMDRNLTLDEIESGGADKSGGVRPGTSHSKVLYALSQIDDDGPKPTKSIIRQLDIPDGTAYAAMSDLHDRGLVNRTDEQKFDNSYGYTVSEKGEEELSRLDMVK